MTLTTGTAARTTFVIRTKPTDNREGHCNQVGGTDDPACGGKEEPTIGTTPFASGKK